MTDNYRAKAEQIAGSVTDFYGSNKVADALDELVDLAEEADEHITQLARALAVNTIHQRPLPHRRIWVTFQRAGIHLYPAAATDPNLADVSYLGHPHRHLFKFRVSIEVFHEDRELEFHQFLNWLESLYDQGTLELNHKSCEMIGDELAQIILTQYPGRALTVEVSEDGECGCTLSYRRE